MSKYIISKDTVTSNRVSCVPLRIKTSTTDVRENTVISGHAEIGTLYEANNVVYPESVCVNLMNAPGNSTTQCDCGHINCPFCNLMMNLELTDPSVLK